MAGIGKSTGSGGAAPDLGPTISADELGGNVSQKSFAQAIAQLQFSGHKDTANDLLKKYGSNIDPAFFMAAGVKAPKPSKGGGGFMGAIGGVLGPVARFLGRPQQVLYAGVHDISSTVRQAFGGKPLAGDNGYGNILKAAEGKTNLNPYDVVGRPHDTTLAPQFAAGLEKLHMGHIPVISAALRKTAQPTLNLVAGATTDPLIGLGGGAKDVEAVTQILKGAGLGETAIEAGRSGFRALAPEAQQAVREAVHGSEELANMRPRPGFIKALDQTPEQRLLGAYEAGARKGVHFAGQTIIPTTPLSNAVNIIPGVEAARGAVSAGLEKLAPIFSQPARLTRSIGEKGSEALQALRRTAGAAENRAAVDAVTRFKPFVDLLPEEQKAIIRGLEKGADYADVVRPTLSAKGQAAMDEFMAARAEGTAAKTATMTVDQTEMSLAHTNEALHRLSQEAADTAAAKYTAEVQQPLTAARADLLKAQNDAAKVLQNHDLAQQKIAEANALGRSPSEYVIKRSHIMEERARVARQTIRDAESTVAKAEAKAAKDSALVNDVAEKARTEAMDKLAKSGHFLMPEDQYFHHGFTPDGSKLYRQLVKKDPAAAKQMASDLRDLNAGGSLENRTIQGELPSVEEQWQNRFKSAGIDTKGAKVLESNPAMAFAKMAVHDQQAVSELKTLSELSTVPNKAGTAPLIIAGDTVDAEGNIITAAERAAKEGYVPVKSDIAKGAFGPPELMPHLENLQAVTHNDADLQAFSNFWKKWDSQWSRYTTSLSMTKRYIGHLFNSFLGGIKDPEAYIRAFKMQQADRAAREEVGRAVGPEWEQAMVKRLGEREANIYFKALESGVGSTGFMPQNINNTLQREMGAGGNANPFSSSFKPLAKIGDVNQAIDNNVRLGHYVGAFENTGSHKAAADSVYKYLFDYSELTPTEQKFKQYARFYTYLRKNTPLQVLGLIEHPGVYSTTFRVKKALAESMPAGAGPFPKYALDAGGVPTSAGVLGMDMPFEHAVKFLTPALQSAAMVPGLKELLPHDFRPEGGVGEVLRGFAGNLAGGPMALAKAGVEQATGKTLLSGADITKNTGTRLRQLLNQVAPFTSKVNPLIHSQGGAVLPQLLGKAANVTVTPINDTTRASEYRREAKVLQDIISKYNANGTKLPTYQELVTAGVVPTAKEAKSILAGARITTSQKKANLSKAEKRAAALKKIKR